MKNAGKDSVRATLTAESLGHFNWFEDRQPRADEVGIVQADSGWQVYSTDERAGAQYEKVHEDQGEALADFLKKVRATNRYFALRAERPGKQAEA